MRPTVGDYAKPALCASVRLFDGAAERELVLEPAGRRTVCMHRLARHWAAVRPFASAAA